MVREKVDVEEDWGSYGFGEILGKEWVMQMQSKEVVGRCKSGRGATKGKRGIVVEGSGTTRLCLNGSGRVLGWAVVDVGRKKVQWRTATAGKGGRRGVDRWERLEQTGLSQGGNARFPFKIDVPIMVNGSLSWLLQCFPFFTRVAGTFFCK